MQDIMDKLQHILSTKEGQEQLKNISSMLNNNANTNDNNSNNNTSTNGATSSENTNNNQSNQNNQSNSAQGGFDMSAITSMLSGLQGGGGGGNPLADTLSSFINNNSSNNNNNNSNSNNTQEGFPNIDMNMIMGIQKAFSAMNVNDKNTQLLIALKPHFSPERSKKVDQALGLMRLMTALPTLKDSGILSGIL